MFQGISAAAPEGLDYFHGFVRFSISLTVLYFRLRIYELFKIYASDLLKTFVASSKMYDSIRNMRLAEYLARMLGLE